MTSLPRHPQLDSGVPSKRDHRNTKRSDHDPHGNVWYVFRVLLPTLELETAIISRQKPRKPNKHLSQRRVYVKVELAFEVVRTELSKVRFIPDDDV